MADEDRSFAPNTVQANRARTQGLGVGQREMDLQRDPGREEHAIDPERTEPFDTHLEAGPPMEHTPQVLAGDVVPPAAAEADDGAENEDKPWLGEGVPQNVDAHAVGDRDTPEDDWGEPAGEGALHGANHTRRPIKTEAERGQGAKTRQHTKDIISRRS
ncbi:MAG: hypothetical protein JWQ97_2776 [Phenylobacterium sp.]|nr:hypothetical protein [Phenylobacterium sp.]